MELIKISFHFISIFFHRIRVCNCGNVVIRTDVRTECSLKRMVIEHWIDQWGAREIHRMNFPMK